MNKEILLTFDNVVSEDFLNFIRKEIKTMKWGLAHTFESESSTFFYCDTDNYISHQFLFDLFIKKTSLSYKPTRSYVNCYPKGSEGTMHADDGHCTFLFFTDEWNQEYKGSLLFENNKKVEYKANRLVVYNANLKHKAETHLADKMRHSIAWKTLKWKPLT